MFGDHWRYWLASFVIVIVLLSIAAGIEDEIERRKKGRGK